MDTDKMCDQRTDAIGGQVKEKGYFVTVIEGINSALLSRTKDKGKRKVLNAILVLFLKVKQLKTSI